MKTTLHLIAYSIVLFFGNLNSTWAQQQWQYSQYMNNNFLLNPAEGGTENFTDVKLGLRTQWQGMEGNPRSGFLSAHHPINKNNSQFDDVKPLPHHGVGGYISSDQAGPITQSSLYGSYSYHLPLTVKTTLSFGAFLGVKQFQLNKDALKFENGESDIVTNGYGTNYLPDATMGLWLYSANYYVGGSSFQLLGNKINTSSISNSLNESSLSRHYFVTAGYKLPLTDKVFIVPSFVAKYTAPAPIQFDVNAKIRYQDLYWTGVSYRNKDAVVLLAGLTLDKKWDLGFSYDINTSALNPYNSGSYEILIGYRVNHSAVMPTSQFW